MAPPTGLAHRIAVTQTITRWTHWVARRGATVPEREMLARAFGAGFKFCFAPHQDLNSQSGRWDYTHRRVENPAN